MPLQNLKALQKKVNQISYLTKWLQFKYQNAAIKTAAYKSLTMY